jgi:hypothetical protein
MDVDLPRGDASNDRPFRADFSQLFGLYGSYGPGYPSDLWACLEGRLFSGVRQNNIPKLRKRLQIDYFFHPEDTPYKISPRLFRTAVKHDDELEAGDENGLSILALLFELDPYSLPCKSKAVKEWAKEAAFRIYEEANSLTLAHAYIRRRQASDNPLSGKAARDFVRAARVAAYIHAQDRAILRYMKDGVVKEEKNLLSPAFGGPVFDDDIEKFVAEAEANPSSTTPSREQYLAMTASQLRDELHNRGLRPYSVGTRKADYVSRLMLEDQMGNIHREADEDLDSLIRFVGDMHFSKDHEGIEPAGQRRADDEDGMDTPVEEHVPEDMSYEEPYNSDLDYVATFANDISYCNMLDRMEDYAWFEEV